MKIKEQINHRTIQKICPFYNDIFHLIHLCTPANFTLSPPHCYEMREKKN